MRRELGFPRLFVQQERAARDAVQEHALLHRGDLGLALAGLEELRVQQVQREGVSVAGEQVRLGRLVLRDFLLGGLAGGWRGFFCFGFHLHDFAVERAELALFAPRKALLVGADFLGAQQPLVLDEDVLEVDGGGQPLGRELLQLLRGLGALLGRAGAEITDDDFLAESAHLTLSS